VVALLVGLASGCYSPTIPSGGFFCKSDPTCPEHFFCVDGRCVDHIEYDLLPAPDLSPSGPDLAGPSCGATGDYCRHDSDCCGHYCIYRNSQCR
jgi:hypothetical protein